MVKKDPNLTFERANLEGRLTLCSGCGGHMGYHPVEAVYGGVRTKLIYCVERCGRNHFITPQSHEEQPKGYYPGPNTENSH